MNNSEVIERLEAIAASFYPLSIDEDDGAAMVECIQRIMDAVPEEERIMLRGDYNLVTSALMHPVGPSGGERNIRL